MNQGRWTGGGGQATPIEDPGEIRGAMTDLQVGEAEFQIKVEGAHTLPYTARIQHLVLAKGILHLKLIRPLPHEMATGAPFVMLFTVGDQRFEAPTTFLGREAYLLYRFTLPVRMNPCDRRRNKRYPFRPREKAYVMAQDGSIPGHGLSGPLVNLSLGGLAFRVDRVVQLDLHLRITPGLGFFDRGKELPVLKIRDLPKLPLFEARGTVANAWERDGEIIVGVQFGEMREAELRPLREVLEARERMLRSPANVPGAAPREGRSAPAESEAPTHARLTPPAGNQTPDALTRLGRRSAAVLVAMAPGEPRAELMHRLREAGYLRLESVDTLDQALQQLRESQEVVSRLLLLDAPTWSETPLAGIRALQRELGELRELPVALLQHDGLHADTDDPLIRPIPWPGEDPAPWLPALDELAGF
jgi:hypothetical protein